MILSLKKLTIKYSQIIFIFSIFFLNHNIFNRRLEKDNNKVREKNIIGNKCILCQLIKILIKIFLEKVSLCFIVFLPH